MSLSHTYHAIRKWGFRTVWKSFRFNRRYWSLSVALKLPVIVDKNVCFNRLSGKIELQHFDTGSVLIGVNRIGIFDKKYSRTVLEFCDGAHIRFGKNVSIGHGCRISVQSGAELSLESDTFFTAETIVVCAKKITFSEGCLVSWHAQFMDSDLHTVKKATGEILNLPAEIFIGPRNWFGSGAQVFKGTQIGADNVIGANTCFYGDDFSSANQTVLVGNPARIAKTDIRWNR